MKNGNMYLNLVLSIFKDLAIEFIKKLLVVDPKKRLNSEEALNHSWFNILEPYPDSTITESPVYNTPVSPNPPVKDLLPTVEKGLNTRKLFGKALDMMKAVNKLAAGISKSHIHLGTDEAASPTPASPTPLSPQAMSRQISKAQMDLPPTSNSKPSNAAI
jgi:serine/threonine protein kinase